MEISCNNFNVMSKEEMIEHLVRYHDMPVIVYKLGKFGLMTMHTGALESDNIKEKK